MRYPSLVPLVLTLMFVLPKCGLLAQESKIETSNFQTIKGDRWELSLAYVKANPYNEKGYSQGKTFIKFEGYKLAQTLLQLAKHANSYLEVANLPENPPVVLTLWFGNSTLDSIWPDVLEKIASHYKVTVHQKKKKVLLKVLTITDRKKIERHKAKETNSGVLNSAVVKENKIILNKFTLDELARWLSFNYPYRFTCTTAAATAADFVLPAISWPALEAVLLNKYGILTSDSSEEHVVYLISY